MAVYVIAWTLFRETPAGNEFRTLQQVVKGNIDVVEAAEAVGDAFPETEEAKAGWELLGPPGALEATEERMTEWKPYARPEPVNGNTRPRHLKPVPDD